MIKMGAYKLQQCELLDDCLLKMATINYALKFVMNSSIIVLSYNNIVP